ncbi:MAG: DUF4954 family protein [Planctomycetota bacterium]
MSDPLHYRALTPAEIKTLESQACRAADWSKVQAAAGFDPARVVGASFSGEVRLGGNQGSVVSAGGVEQPAGVYYAALTNVTLEDNVRIVGVSGGIVNYNIDRGALIEGVGRMAATPGSSFGNGVAVETVNEGGGREVPIFDELTAQIAYLVAMRKGEAALQKRLHGLIATHAATKKAARGRIGAGAVVRQAIELKDVNVGPAAKVEGATLLQNGTILSEAGAPTEIGHAVVAKDFIVAEGSSVTEGAILSKVFVGQGVKLGKQFSAENSLFFANCEGFHGEAVAVFAGPYTVTHHKSTLLIAGMFSFYNAGSGTNQSNHMYKLGPLHQGVVERGSKTGSFSYMLWPCRLGPFSVVIGKNMSRFDLGDFPFSYVTAHNEKSTIVPGMNLTTVGTLRDGQKWPSRDRRKAADKRDLIRFEVVSPFTVGRMVNGEKILRELADGTPKDVDEVKLNGAICKRLVLRTGERTYRNAIDLWLAERVLARAETGIGGGKAGLAKALGAPTGAVHSTQWADLAGMLVAVDRLHALEAKIAGGEVDSLAALHGALKEAHAIYPADEWAYVRELYKARREKYPEALSAQELSEIAGQVGADRSKFLRLIVKDAEKEFEPAIQIGFGADTPPGDAARVAADFTAVRGTLEGDKFVKGLHAEMAALAKRVADFQQAVAKLQ